MRVDWGLFLSLSPLLPVGANSISFSSLKLLPFLAGKLKASNMDQGANLEALEALQTP